MLILYGSLPGHTLKARPLTLSGDCLCAKEFNFHIAAASESNSGPIQ